MPNHELGRRIVVDNFHQMIKKIENAGD